SRLALMEMEGSMRHSIAVALLTLFALTAPRRASSAPDVLVTFDDLPPGTAVVDQFRDAGGPARGLVFGRNAALGDTAVPLVTDVGADQANSGTQIGKLTVTCPNGQCPGFRPRPAGPFPPLQ